LSNNSLIIALSVLGLALIGSFVAIIIFYNGDKGLAVAGLVTVAGLIIPQLLSLKASTDNATRLDKVNAKIDDNTVTTEMTHHAVNSRMDEMIATVKRLSEVQNDLIAAQSLAQGITIGREQIDKPPDHPAT